MLTRHVLSSMVSHIVAGSYLCSGYGDPENKFYLVKLFLGWKMMLRLKEKRGPGLN